MLSSKIISMLYGWVLTAIRRRAVYFFVKHNPLQFRVCAIFQLSIDCGE